LALDEGELVRTPRL